MQDLEGGLAMMADLSASGVGRGETEAQFYSGSGAGEIRKICWSQDFS